VTDLLFVHGRSQQDKDAVALKGEWTSALRDGLAASGFDMPIPDEAVRFPYYGDTLRDLATDRATVADVVVRGGPDAAEAEFIRSVLRETVEAVDLPKERVDAELEHTEVVERAPQDWPWLSAALRALDGYVPGVSAAGLAIATRDVYLYLRNFAIRDRIEAGVRSALHPGVPTVVVAHSLGSVVAYSLLRREGEREGWQVPLLVSVGSPLAVTAISKALRPVGHPACASSWFNARDPRDIIALHPLDADHFPVRPAVDNKSDVDNGTANRHGISGYLADPEVARRIHAGLTT
jgi:hypothetical protein